MINTIIMVIVMVKMVLVLMLWSLLQCRGQHAEVLCEYRSDIVRRVITNGRFSNTYANDH